MFELGNCHAIGNLFIFYFYVYQKRTTCMILNLDPKFKQIFLVYNKFRVFNFAPIFIGTMLLTTSTIDKTCILKDKLPFLDNFCF